MVVDIGSSNQFMKMVKYDDVYSLFYLECQNVPGTCTEKRMCIKLNLIAFEILPFCTYLFPWH